MSPKGSKDVRAIEVSQKAELEEEWKDTEIISVQFTITRSYPNAFMQIWLALFSIPQFC